MHVYYAAILLDSTLKTAKLRQMWSGDPNIAPWVSQVEEYVKAMWRTQYKPANRASTTSQRLYDEDSAFSRLSSAKRLRLDAPCDLTDALDAYLSIDPEPFVETMVRPLGCVVRPQRSRVEMDIEICLLTFYVSGLT